MKEYVLDEPPPPAPPPAVPVGLPRQPWPWRALLVLAVVEPIALGGLYLALDTDARPLERAQPLGPATIAAFSLPSAPEQRAGAVAVPTEATPAESRIAFERGKYVIDLRSTDVGAALVMLAQATRATVRGGDALAREPTRLSRSAVVSTPAEAWQAVLGDVASFAISCRPKGCAVFVAPVAKADAIAAVSMLPPVAAADAQGETAELAAAAAAAAKLAVGLPVPQTADSSESRN